MHNESRTTPQTGFFTYQPPRLNYCVPAILSFLFTVFIIFIMPLSALDPGKTVTQYRLDLWNIERGFPATSVHCIYQTADGYLWAGTPSGLIRFDGYRFKLIKPTANKKVRALYQEPGGTLWIGFENEGLATYKNGEIVFIPPTKEVPLRSLRAISQSPGGSLLIGTRGYGLIVLDNGNYSVFNARNGLADNQVFSIFTDEFGQIWLGTGTGVTRFNEPREFVHHPVVYREKKLQVYSISKKNGDLLLATSDIFHVMKGNTIVPYPGLKCNVDLSGIAYPSLLTDGNGNLWVGTDGKGLGRIRGNKLTLISTPDGLRDNHIYSLFEDRESSLWFGTLQGGLHRLSNTRFINYTTREGLTGPTVRCIYQEPGGTLWFATLSGLNKLSPGKTKLEPAFSSRNGLAGDMVNAVLRDRVGYLWIATPYGLYRYKNGTMETFTKKHGLAHSKVYDIFQCSKGHLWFFTHSGINRVIPVTGSRRVTFERVPLPVSVTRKIAEAPDHTKWITTDSGLVKYKNGKSTLYSTADGMMANDLLCIYADKQGVVYLGTPSGLCRLENERFTNFTADSGFTFGAVQYILEDDYNRLWLSGRNGICRVSKFELTDFANGKTTEIKPVVYTVRDGLKGPLFRSAGFKCRDGTLWFSALYGLLTFKPSNFGKVANSQPPPVIIEEFIVDGRPVKNVTQNPHTKKVTISPVSSRIEFYYTALSFLDSTKIKFKIQLVGYDKDWIEVGNSYSTTYTGLTPGEYTFNVIACNSEGVWNTKGDSFSFYKSPYFYQTTWFYIAAVLLLIIIVLVIHRIRLHSLIASEKKLSTLVDIRTDALNQRTQELESAHVNIQESKRIILEKNKNILASISYARRIQQALLPTAEAMNIAFQDYFVFFRPKDIISGDFYWFRKINDNYYIALGDCTGHGVPGALLSMIGLIALNDIVKLPAVPTPKELLAFLHLRVREALKQEIDKNNDSIEIALCEIDPKAKTLTFAGAKRPIYYIRDSHFNEIKGYPRPVGGRQKEAERCYEDHVIDISIPTTIYLASDGFADQNCKDNKKYGTPRLRAFLTTLAKLPIQMQSNMLAEELEYYQGEEPQRDDITVIGIKLDNIA